MKDLWGHQCWKVALYGHVSGHWEAYLVLFQTEIFVLDGGLDNPAFSLVPNPLMNTERVKGLK